MTTRNCGKLDGEFQLRARNLIDAELRHRSLSYSDLVELLNARGVQESKKNLKNKVRRGRFSAAFLLLCMDSIQFGVTQARP